MRRFFVFWMLLVASLTARAASPILLAIEPPCGQAGTTQEVVLRGMYLEDIEAVHVHEPGVKVTLLDWAPAKGGDQRLREKRATIEIEPGHQPGNVHLRVRTRSGISPPRSFHINRLPIINEIESETATKGSAQFVEMEHTVWGHLRRYETDWYRIPLKKGTRCSLEVLGLRISATYLDVVLQIFTPDGKLFRETDTSTLYYHDPVCSFQAPMDGEYRVSLRDTRNNFDQDDPRYGFGNDCMYVMHAGDYPQAEAVWPLGGALGRTTSLVFSGGEGGPFRQEVTFAKRESFVRSEPVGADKYPWAFQNPESVYPIQNGVTGTGPAFVMASSVPAFVEEAKHDAPTIAQVLPQVPCVVDGLIGRAGEVDWYSISGKKGDVFHVEVYARRLRSKLDSVLTASAGGSIIENDDLRRYNVDSSLNIKMESDTCLISVRDVRGEGGPDYAYRLVVEPPRSRGVLTVEAVEKQTLLPRFRAGIQAAVPRGGRTLLLLKTAEEGELLPAFRAEITGLPQGVAAEVAEVMGQQAFHPVVLSAAEEAPLDATFATPRGVPLNGGSPIEFQQEVSLIHGHPAQTTWHTAYFQQVAMATVERLPFSVTMRLVEPQAAKGGKAKVVLHVTRDAGAAFPVMFMFPCQPPGGDLGMVEVPAHQSEVEASFEISPDAPVGLWPLVAVAADTDLAHLRDGAWPYYDLKPKDGKKMETQGLNWTCTPISYLEITPKTADFAK